MTTRKPDPRCEIGKIRFKRANRYRSPDAFNITTSKLLREQNKKALLRGVKA